MAAYKAPENKYQILRPAGTKQAQGVWLLREDGRGCWRASSVFFTTGRIIKQLKKFSQSAGPEDDAYFAYLGHGKIIRKAAYTATSGS